MNRVLSTVNSTQSVKGTKTYGVWLKTSRKTVHTTSIRPAVTEAPTGTNQDADLVLILVLVLTLPLFVLSCITLMYCLLRTKNRCRWSEKKDGKSTLSYKSEEPSKFDNLDNKQSNRSWITHWLARTNSSFQSNPSNISLPPDYATAMKISKEAYDIPRASLHGSMDKLSLYSESSRTIIEPTTDFHDPYVHSSRLNKNTSGIVFIPLRDYPR